MGKSEKASIDKSDVGRLEDVLGKNDPILAQKEPEAELPTTANCAVPTEPKAEPETVPGPTPEPEPEPAKVVVSSPTRPVCGKCGSDAIGIAGGLRRCNQCGHSWH